MGDGRGETVLTFHYIRGWLLYQGISWGCKLLEANSIFLSSGCRIFLR